MRDLEAEQACNREAIDVCVGRDDEDENALCERSSDGHILIWSVEVGSKCIKM